MTSRPINKQAHIIDQHVGMRIRVARLELGISQEDLGRRLEISFQQVQKYEKGANRVSAGKLAIIAKALQREIAWFFEGAPGIGAHQDVRPDMAAELLRTIDGRKLAADFISIRAKVDRAAIATLAGSLAHRGSGRA